MPLANLCNRPCCQTGTHWTYRPPSDGLTPACPSRHALPAGSARFLCGPRSAASLTREGARLELNDKERSNCRRRRRLTSTLRWRLFRPRVAGRLASPPRATVGFDVPIRNESSRVDRAPKARSKPAPACSAVTRARRNHPLTLPVASSGTCRPTGRPLRRRPAAAGRSACAPRRTEFPRLSEGPFPHATHQGRRFPEPKRLPPTSPSALWPKPSALPCRLSPAQVPRPRTPWKPGRRGRTPETAGFACAPERRAAAGTAGLNPPGPSFRHAFTSRLAPSR